jgi:hypothetical protein
MRKIILGILAMLFLLAPARADQSDADQHKEAYGIVYGLLTKACEEDQKLMQNPICNSKSSIYVAATCIVDYESPAEQAKCFNERYSELTDKEKEILDR